MCSLAMYVNCGRMLITKAIKDPFKWLDQKCDKSDKCCSDDFPHITLCVELDFI